METLSAIAQISILLIVAFLIGFVTAWLYWRKKYNKLMSEFETEKNRQNAVISKKQQVINKYEGEIKKLNDKLTKVEKTQSNANGQPVPEPLYHRIVRNMGEGVSVSDEEGRFLVFNPKLEEITGYSKEEANQHSEKLFLDELYPDEELRNQATQHIHNVPENDDHTNIKTVITNKEGQKVPVLVSSTMIKHNTDKFYLTAYRDVSEKPEVEA